MSFQDNLTVGKQEMPLRICIYGSHGIGKSTLASKFPNPIFISTEDGLGELEVTSFPLATKIEHVVDNIKTLLKEDHDFKTVVLDSVDWLVESLIITDIESKHDAKELAYGKGQLLTAEAFREILQGLGMLRAKKGMNVVLISHADVVRYEDPRNEPYDRFTPKIPKRCNALLQEWVDVLAFAAFKVIIRQTDAGFNSKKARGVTTGERLLHVVENPAYVAKNRFNCPDTFDMDYDELNTHVRITGEK